MAHLNETALGSDQPEEPDRNEPQNILSDGNSISSKLASFTKSFTIPENPKSQSIVDFRPFLNETQVSFQVEPKPSNSKASDSTTASLGTTLQIQVEMKSPLRKELHYRLSFGNEMEEQIIANEGLVLNQASSCTTDCTIRRHIISLSLPEILHLQLSDPMYASTYSVPPKATSTQPTVPQGNSHLIRENAIELHHSRFVAGDITMNHLQCCNSLILSSRLFSLLRKSLLRQVSAALTVYLLFGLVYNIAIDIINHSVNSLPPDLKINCATSSIMNIQMLFRPLFALMITLPNLLYILPILRYSPWSLYHNFPWFHWALAFLAFDYYLTPTIAPMDHSCCEFGFAHWLLDQVNETSFPPGLKVEGQCNCYSTCQVNFSTFENYLQNYATLEDLKNFQVKLDYLKSFPKSAIPLMHREMKLITDISTFVYLFLLLGQLLKYYYRTDIITESLSMIQKCLLLLLPFLGQLEDTQETIETDTESDTETDTETDTMICDTNHSA